MSKCQTKLSTTKKTSCSNKSLWRHLCHSSAAPLDYHPDSQPVAEVQEDNVWILSQSLSEAMLVILKCPILFFWNGYSVVTRNLLRDRARTDDGLLRWSAHRQSLPTLMEVCRCFLSTCSLVFDIDRDLDFSPVLELSSDCCENFNSRLEQVESDREHGKIAAFDDLSLIHISEPTRPY